MPWTDSSSATPYRLAHWRVAGEEINYRRFFDINTLAAIRVEDPEVFEEAHQIPFQLLADGQVHGLRIDHPDGLFDPSGYFLRLQERYFVDQARRLARIATDDPDWPELRTALAARWRREVEGDPTSPLRKGLYLVVEKIQGGRERIPEDWAVHGTTGYRFANLTTGLLVDATAERELTETYHRFIGQPLDLAALVVEKKKQVMAVAMASEINGLARELNRISEMNRRTRDFTLNSTRRALIGFIAHVPVYRTYVSGANGVDERDAHYIRWTVARARAADPTTNASLFQWLEDVLLKRYPDHLPAPEREVLLGFAMKLQQLTGPVMAKGLEDTVFYVYNRLVALNEVGGEPEHFGTGVETFHQRNLERARGFPGALVASTTHDTKRSEDVRARLAVLSELPGDWRRAVETWGRINAPHRTALGRRALPRRTTSTSSTRRCSGPGRWESRGRRSSLPSRPAADVHAQGHPGGEGSHQLDQPDPSYEEATVRSWSGRWTPASAVRSWSRRAGSRRGWSSPARSMPWPR
jgi:(1->4)-alpha-D-glucan 1-alpha-D-glucosylmutase